MSEKRFTVDKVGIYDNQEKKHFKFTAYDWVDCDIYECCEKLNEQQAIIEAKDSLLSILSKENEQLRQQLKEKEEDEQLYANEIVKLNKEAKEVLDFKSLGGDY